MKSKGIILLLILIAGLLVLLFGVKREEALKVSSTVGLEAPEVSVRDVSGRTFALPDLKGSVVFINFWASWCDPCKEEMPSIQSLYTHFKDDKRFRMITVIFKDEYQQATAFLKENNFVLPVFTDVDGRTARAYGVTGVPETYILDKRGVLRDKVIGPADWNSPKAIALISNLINE